MMIFLKKNAKDDFISAEEMLGTDANINASFALNSICSDLLFAHILYTY